ncbi:hypothetical protein NE237_016351 [Protea cynaroides]|uniref:Uncharacterized protein n=1 Tax=Protea cynaroides TaxID=273540 RepID=A0A9Q0JTD8_9MAGN|nr:hypothetical protein NE237_016351 [Protea cynaroides]
MTPPETYGDLSIWSQPGSLYAEAVKSVRGAMQKSVKATRDATCSFRSFSFGVEHSFFLVRVLSEPSRDVNATYEVESVCLVFHLIRELRSEGLQISTELGHT